MMEYEITEADREAAEQVVKEVRGGAVSDMRAGWMMPDASSFLDDDQAREVMTTRLTEALAANHVEADLSNAPLAYLAALYGAAISPVSEILLRFHPIPDDDLSRALGQ